MMNFNAWTTQYSWLNTKKGNCTYVHMLCINPRLFEVVVNLAYIKHSIMEAFRVETNLHKVLLYTNVYGLLNKIGSVASVTLGW